MILWDDIKNLACDLHEDWWDRYRKVRLEDTVIPINGLGNNGSTDASGKLTLKVFENRTGRTTLIGRMIISADGYTPATPYTSASAYAYVFVGETFGGFYLDFAPSTANTQLFPNVAEYSSRNALRLGPNDILSLYVVGGPATTNISAFVWGEALPNSADRKIL